MKDECFAVLLGFSYKHRHGSSEQMSPTEYENQYYQRLGSV
uniref:Uncharacterized protein n=1 Tax=Raoultella ornithinolytica TaxID=54291 RepID=A0A7G9A668_RAOOR|nr:Hypothetical protein [Raoultella ornithinolytica]